MPPSILPSDLSSGLTLSTETTGRGKKPKSVRAYWFENGIARHLLEQSTKSGRRNTLVRGSSVGSACLRRIGYMLLGYEEGPQTAHQQFVLALGNAIHDMIQTWMSRLGWVGARPYLDDAGNLCWEGDAEIRVWDPETGVIGHCDGLSQPILPSSDNGVHCLAIDPEGQRYLLEFKTIANRSRVDLVWAEKDTIKKYVLPPGKTVYDEQPRLKGSPPKKIGYKGTERYVEILETENLGDALKEGADVLLDIYHKPGAFDSLTGPKPEHIDQATFYASRLKADRILIVYIAKDTGEDNYEEENSLNVPVKAYDLPVDPEVISRLEARLEGLWRHMEARSEESDNPEDWLVDRPFHPNDYPFSECTYCPYTYVCYPDVPEVARKVGQRIAEMKAIGLPVPSGQAFVRHGKEEWGRVYARNHPPQDGHH